MDLTINKRILLSLSFFFHMVWKLSIKNTLDFKCYGLIYFDLVIDIRFILALSCDREVMCWVMERKLNFVSYCLIICIYDKHDTVAGIGLRIVQIGTYIRSNMAGSEPCKLQCNLFQKEKKRIYMSSSIRYWLN